MFNNPENVGGAGWMGGTRFLGFKNSRNNTLIESEVCVGDEYINLEAIGYEDYNIHRGNMVLRSFGASFARGSIYPDIYRNQEYVFKITNETTGQTTSNIMPIDSSAQYTNGIIFKEVLGTTLENSPTIPHLPPGIQLPVNINP